MAIETTAEATLNDENVEATRVYEIGYHIVPTVPEEGVEETVNTLRKGIESAGGTFIAEGTPTLVRLAYSIEGGVGGRANEHDRGYFGWLKFEVTPQGMLTLDAALKQNQNILRHMILETVREDTRARLKIPTVREVKRTEPVRAAPRRVEESSAPVSEEDLDKALSDITSD